MEILSVLILTTMKICNERDIRVLIQRNHIPYSLSSACLLFWCQLILKSSRDERVPF